MLPGSDNFWHKIKNPTPEEVVVPNTRVDSPSILPQNDHITSKPKKRTIAKSLTWGDIRAMNDAYIKDIEKKNIEIKPEETFTDLLKTVQTFESPETKA